MVDAATNFRKNGFNDEDAASLARVSSMFQNVADETISAGDSAEFLISQLIAFNQTTGDVEANATHIIDAVNSVANNFAVGTGDLATGLKIVASTSSSMGNSLESTIGMLTAITEQTKNASKASRGLNAIFANLSQVLDPASSNGKKIIQIFDDLNVSMYDNEEQLRSSYELLGELAEKWDGLDGNTQKYIATTLAGTTQLNNFLALMNNFDHATEATNTALNSQGSALNENASYMESVQAQLSQLGSQFQQFANNVLDSGLVNGLLSIAKSLLQIASTPLGTIVSQIVLLTSLGWGATSLAHATGIFNVVIGQFKNLIPLLKNAAMGIMGLQGPLLATGAAGSIALPILLGISAAIVGLYAFSKTDWFQKTFNGAEYVENKISEINAEIEETKQKIQELKEQGANQNVIDMYSDKLEGLQKQLAEFNQKRFDLTFGNATTQPTVSYGGKEWATQSLIIQGQIDKYYELKEAMQKATSTEEFEKLEDQLNELVGTFEEYHVVGQQAVADGAEMDDTQRDLWYQLIDIVGTTEEVAQKTVDLRIAQAQTAPAAAVLANQLINEAGQLGITKEKMIDLIYQSIVFNNTDFDVSQKVAALAQVAEMAFGVQGALAGISNGGLVNDPTYRQLMNSGMSQAEAEQAYLQIKWNTWLAAYRKALAEADVVTTDDTGTGTGTGGSSATKEKTAVEKLTEAWKEQLSLLKDRLELLEKSGATEEEQVAQMKKIQEAIHATANKYRALGLSEDSEQVRQLKILWWDYQNDIDKIYDEIEKRAKEAAEKQAEEEKKAAEEAKEAWEKALNERKDAYEAASSYMVDRIDERLEALEKQKTEEEQKWQDEIDKLNEENGLLEDQIKYQQLLDNLAKAKSKKLYVFKDGQFQYVQDVEAIAEAQSELDSYNREKALEEETKRLEALKDEAVENIQTQIDWWQKYREEWADVTQQYTREQNRLLAEQALGIKLEGDNWAIRLGQAKKFANEYTGIMSEITAVGNMVPTAGEAGGGYKGASSGISGYDLAEIQRAKQDFANAKTDEERIEAHQRAEAIRNKYGYSGGVDGSHYIPKTPTVSSSKGGSSSSSGTKSAVSTVISGITSVIKKLTGHADGTLGAAGGLSLVGEQGPELRVLGNGDGIIPADVTRNLWNWGKIDPTVLSNRSNTQIFNIDNLSLPNARDAESLVAGLKNLAYQRVYKRA